MTRTKAVRPSSRTHSYRRIIAGVVLGLSLAGCASDYKAVKQGDLSDIKAQLDQTERALKSIEREQAASRDLLYTAERDSLQRLIATVKEQVKPPECPVVEAPRSNCETVSRPAPVAPKPRDAANTVDNKLIIGELEKVFLDPPGGVYLARIDTGAETASLDARDVQTFERDGNDWVRFKMPAPSGEGLVDVERRVSRFVRILQSSDDDSERRPVIKMRLVIGNVERLAEFTLSDREHLEYPVLIGRNVLKDTMLVDVSRNTSVPLPKELRNSESPNEE